MLQSPVIILPSPGPHTPAIIVPPGPGLPATDALRLSHRQLSSTVAAAQARLAELGIAPGCRVAVALPNGIEFVVVFLALIRQRAAVAPLNPDAKLNEQTQMLERIRPSWVIVPGRPAGETCSPSSTSSSAALLASATLHIPVALCIWDQAGHQLSLGQATHDMERGPSAPAPDPVPAVEPQDVRPDDVVLLHYTSGTTGQPKAVGLTHATILSSVGILVKAHALLPTDRTAIVAPFFHVGGTCSSLLCALAAGGSAVIPRSLSGDIWHQFRDHGATWYHAVPTLHRLLLSFPRPAGGLPLLRFVRSGGGSISGDLVARVERALGCPVLEGYGMTETVQAVFCNRIADPPEARRPGHYPVPEEMEVRLRIPGGDDDDDAYRLTDQTGQAGEICVRGPCVLSGYLDDPAADRESFLADGFFRTGDLGTLLPDGRLHVTGRIKEMINKGGEKISPFEIESVVLNHAAVQQAACFKVQDDIYGEDIGIAVVVKEGCHLSALDLKRFVRQHSTDFKVPKLVSFIDAIPTNRSGKVMRASLADRFGRVQVIT